MLQPSSKLDQLLPSLRPSPRMPVVFAGHGSPMNAVENNVWRFTWQDLGQELLRDYPRPQWILCISAHWLTRDGWQLTGAAQPSTLHDFGGFPPELYAQRYPVPGAPHSAREVAAWLKRQPVTVDAERGLDHGAWCVLQSMFPQADIPVSQLSMDGTRPARAHWVLGQKLALLRDRGVLIVASGNLVHNLSTLRHGSGINGTYRWALRFDDHVSNLILTGELETLTQFQQWGDVVEVCHPTHEHFLPLLYAAGAVLPGDVPRFFNAGFQAASISMRSVLWQPQPQRQSG